MSSMRHPLISTPFIRVPLGAFVAAGAAYWLSSPDTFLATMLATLSGWAPAVWLTDKYRHKYAARYWTYLLASHAKAIVVQALLIAPAGWWVVVSFGVSWTNLATVCGAAALIDLGVAAVSRRTNQQAPGLLAPAPLAAESDPPFEAVNTAAMSRALDVMLPSAARQVLTAALTASDVGPDAVVTWDGEGRPPSGGLIHLRPRVNDIRYIDELFDEAAQAVPFGGYFICRYVPHTMRVAALRRRFGSGWAFRVAWLTQFALHRAWPKLPRLNAVYFAATGARNRLLSKVEVWGRLSYAGWRVAVECPDNAETWVLAQRVAKRPTNKRPSYYPVVPLEKVGLQGGVIYLHKIRSMYPYSEFLQKRMFEEHGLTTTGKFANDFRLTEYGPFIRKYWIDELPQWFDWLRGDVKLVGMRATSRHYLSLYPQELIDLYLKTKPGLIPPIFDEATPGFDGIVATELGYLRRYQQAPLRTDVKYFFKTFSDIFLRGVRSK